MATSQGSGGATGAQPTIVPVLPTATAAGTPPDRLDSKKVDQAEKTIREETQTEMMSQLQQNRTFTVTASLVQRLRAQLAAQMVNGERQFSDREIQGAIAHYFNNANNPMDGLPHPTPELQAALRGDVPPSTTAKQGTGGQPGGNPSGTGQGDAYVPGQPKTPAGATAVATAVTTDATPVATAATTDATPVDTTVATAMPTLRPPTPRGMPLQKPLVAAGTGHTDMPLVPEGPPAVPGEPVVLAQAPGTPAQPAPVVPRRPEGMRGRSELLLDTADPRGTGASTDTKGEFYTTVAKAQFMFSGNRVQVPVQVPLGRPAVATDTVAALSRGEGDDRGEGGERTEGVPGQGKGTGMGRAFALAMKRERRFC